jgi:spermidine synthase
MKHSRASHWVWFLGVLLACALGRADQIFEVTSTYHHIRVVDQDGLRTLYFDDAPESRMSMQDPLRGHFEYTEYFHMPLLWNASLNNVLMIGLGAGTSQRAFEHYYPGVTVETVEIDPTVVRVARDYFKFTESARQKVHEADGRVFLRRSTAHYDSIILDAYVTSRYGSSIPPHLVT